MVAQPQLIPDEIIGDLVVQAQQLTCSIPEVELDEDVEEAVITDSTKLIDRILSKYQVQKFQVINSINKAWILQRDIVVSQLDKHRNILSFSFTLTKDRDGI